MVRPWNNELLPVILSGAKRNEESPEPFEILRSSSLRLASLRMTMVARGVVRGWQA